jgi:predicted peroxiredoxin
MALENTKEKELVVVVTRGIDSELSSVALVIALGGMTAGQKVSLFLASAGVDLVRRRGAGLTHVPPLDPLAAMIADFQSRGGEIWACPPCVKTRGYGAEDLLDGVEIVGASKMHAAIMAGAGTLTF